jgi:hypothetical protein
MTPMFLVWWDCHFLRWRRLREKQILEEWVVDRTRNCEGHINQTDFFFPGIWFIVDATDPG